MIGYPPHRDGRMVTLAFETADGPVHAIVDVPDGVLTDHAADAALVAGLLPAMARRESLLVHGAVSPRLRAGSERIADILLTWDRALHPERHWYGRVPVTTVDTYTDAPTDAFTDAGTPRPDAAAQFPTRGVACFFTGGVDSFHTVLARRDELDLLVFAHGFDLVDDRANALNHAVSQRLRDAAAQLGLPLLEVQCNFVAFAAASGIGWDDYHGAGLATVAHLLAPHVATMYVPATTTYDRLYPLGSHPLLDPLWSSERVEIVHDGADATRVEKMRLIADHPAAREHLRVCTENRHGRYNCGECEKCIRTAVAARIAGVEGAFVPLPSPSLRRIAAVDVPGLGTTWQAFADELTRTGASERLRRAIGVALLRRRLDASSARRVLDRVRRS